MAAFMTTEEVASEFRVEIQTVRRWKREGKLACTKVGRRLLFERGYIDQVKARRGAGSEDFGADLRRRLGRSSTATKSTENTKKI